MRVASWPPCPSVEDEVTALAHEHSIDVSVHVSKSEDQPALDRGSVDQYPIIIDLPDHTQPERLMGKSTLGPEPLLADISSSDDSAGPPTPPPLFRKEQKQPEFAQPTSAVESQGSRLSPSPPTGIQRQHSNRGRPQVTRIQTDVGGDLSSMTTGNRHPPSPYSSTRAPTFPGTDAGCMRPAEPIVSQHVIASPSSLADQNHQTLSSAYRAADRLVVPPSYAAMDNSQQVRPRSQAGSNHSDQFHGHHVKPTFVYFESGAPRRPSQDSKRQSYYEGSKRLSAEYTPLSPPHSRRPSRESGFGSSNDDRPMRHSPPHQRRGTHGSRQSPQTSSAEESSCGHGHRSERVSGDEGRRHRRRSSHRHERPTLVDSRKNSNADSVPSSANGGQQSRYYRYDPRDEYQLHPMAPHTSDLRNAAVAAEDVFDRAFRENASRTRHDHSPRSSGSTLASPLSSPPRTPKIDRQSKDYFELTPKMQRPVQRSRPPSVDEGQTKDSRAHSTLLSAATTGAAIAARTSGTTTRSSGHSTDASSSSATSKAPSAPRSRRSSPVSENPHTLVRAVANSPASQYVSSPTILLSSSDGWPISRGNTSAVDNAQYHPHPHRALSYSGPDHGHAWNTSNSPSAVSPVCINTAVIPGPGHSAPPVRGARSSMYSTEVLPTGKDLTGLPICPRSQPTIGHHDWWTIKELSDIDICPTCMSIVGNTRYRDLFVRSIPRPYNEPSVCAMSKPWVRIAFMQAIKQNMPDLRWVRFAAILPPDTQPCAGSKPDVRAWFRVIDPQTRAFIPAFYACSACIRIVDKVFNPICNLFVRPDVNLLQERSCSLHVHSRHFQSLMDEFDQATARRKARMIARSADVEPVIRHIRKVARYQPCPRDEIQSNRGWHLLPELPELTVCEECYDEVVWPVNDRYIARDISKSLKTVPQARSNANRTGNSCQLYSDRMRRIFLDAVNRRDFTSLREAVQARTKHQHRLTEMNKLYEQDMKFGIDRRGEIERNRQIWRTIE